MCASLALLRYIATIFVCFLRILCSFMRVYVHIVTQKIFFVNLSNIYRQEKVIVI